MSSRGKHQAAAGLACISGPGSGSSSSPLYGGVAGLGSQAAANLQLGGGGGAAGGGGGDHLHPPAPAAAAAPLGSSPFSSSSSSHDRMALAR